MEYSSSKAERIQGIKNGKGIQALLQEAYEILGNPILMHDMEYKIIAINQNVVTDDPIWNEYAEKGTVDFSWLQFFKNECFLEEAANAKTITFLISDKLKYDRIFGKLFNKNNIQVGCAVLMASNKPFEQSDPIFFEAICAILSSEIGRIEFYNEYGQRYFEQLIDELIAGVDDIALYTAHVESIYMHLKSNLYLAVADIGEHEPAYSGLAQLRDILKEAQPEYAYSVHAGRIVILLGIEDSALTVERDLARLNRLFHTHNIYAGVSSSFENLFELNRYYREALGALCGGSRGTGQHIFLQGSV